MGKVSFPLTSRAYSRPLAQRNREETSTPQQCCFANLVANRRRAACLWTLPLLPDNSAKADRWFASPWRFCLDQGKPEIIHNRKGRRGEGSGLLTKSGDSAQNLQTRSDCQTLAFFPDGLP